MQGRFPLLNSFRPVSFYLLFFLHIQRYAILIPEATKFLHWFWLVLLFILFHCPGLKISWRYVNVLPFCTNAPSLSKVMIPILVLMVHIHKDASPCTFYRFVRRNSLTKIRNSTNCWKHPEAFTGEHLVQMFGAIMLSLTTYFWPY